MKAFEQADGSVSGEHRYYVFRQVNGDGEVHFAFPAHLSSIECGRLATDLMGEGWYWHVLDDPTYEQPKPQAEIERWRDNFLTSLRERAVAQAVS